MMVGDRMSKMMIDYLVGQRKYKKFAALYQDDEYGQSFRTSLAKDLARHGLKMVATEPVKPGDTDVRAQVAKLQGAKPEVTFLVLVPGPAAQALRERQKIGWAETLMVSVGPLTMSVDRKSTRLNSSHRTISYAVFCLKKKKHQQTQHA